MAKNMAMGQPPLDQLMEKMDSRYSLVVVAAKRARAITDKAEKGDYGNEEITAKPVTFALNEIVKDGVKFRRTKQGIK
mgnify:CR=1 FL=1